MFVPQFPKFLPKALALSAICFFSGALKAQTFQFTAIPDQDTARLEQRFDKVATYLTETLGVTVEYIPVKSYSASVTAFRNNQVQLAWFGGLSGVQARRGRPGGTALAQGEEDQHFTTYFIAHHSTEIKPNSEFPLEIANKTFTFGSKSSTSGRLMPEYYIREYLHQEPSEVFTRVGFSGDHSQTIALVQAGSYQVGVVNYQVWDNELAAGLIDTQQVQVIWQTPNYPDYNWTIRKDVDDTFGEGFSAKVQAALINMNDPELLAAFPRSSFVNASNDDYQAILDTAIHIGLIDD